MFKQIQVHFSSSRLGVVLSQVESNLLTSVTPRSTCYQLKKGLT